MYCEQCGAELEQDARFCSACGKQAAFEHDDSVGQQYVHDKPTWRVRLSSRKWIIAASVTALVLGGTLFWMAGPETIDLANLTADPKAATEHNFGEAIAQYLKYRSQTPYGNGRFMYYSYCLGNTRYPVSRSDGTRSGETEVLGLVKLKRVNREWDGVYDLTDKGRSTFTPGKGFCYGEPKLLRVSNFTAPSTFGAYTMSNVMYEYQIINIPDWARQPDAAKHWQISKALSSEITPLKDDATLILTNKGWIHQSLFDK